jgi:hypothetical protein
MVVLSNVSPLALASHTFPTLIVIHDSAADKIQLLYQHLSIVYTDVIQE